jgi:hypothetical protein
VVVEIAVSLVLLVGAGLLLRGFLELSGTEPGLATDHVLTAHLPLPAAELPGATPRLFRPLLQEIRNIPGVRSAAVVSMLPIQNAWTNAGFAVEDRPPLLASQAPTAEIRTASPGFFQSLGIPLQRGRDFTDLDGEKGPDVVIVNATLARRHFPGEDPVGRRLLLGTTPFTIVGVVGDVRQAGLDLDPLAEIYFPYGFDNGMLGDAVLVLRTAVPPGASRTRCGPRSGRSIPRCRSTTCSAWRRSSPGLSPAAASTSGSSASSPGWPWCLRPPVSTA